jgi:ADP-L-glycero-D-manno-heptose 6-epimerase
MPPELTAQYQNYTQADMSQLRSVGFSQPATTLEDGVRRSIEAAGQGT